MNKWGWIAGFLIFFSIYLTVEIFSEERKLTRLYMDSANKADSAATYYFLKYINCKTK